MSPATLLQARRSPEPAHHTSIRMSSRGRDEGTPPPQSRQAGWKGKCPPLKEERPMPVHEIQVLRGPVCLLCEMGLLYLTRLWRQPKKAKDEQSLCRLYLAPAVGAGNIDQLLWGLCFLHVPGVPQGPRLSLVTSPEVLPHLLCPQSSAQKNLKTLSPPHYPEPTENRL